MPTDSIQTPTAAPLMTVRDAARKLGVKTHRLVHAIGVYDVEPHQRAGIIRLYSAEQLPALAAAVRRCAGRRSN